MKKDNCSDCGKEFNLYELFKVGNSGKLILNPYKMVCEECFDKGNYAYTGRYEK